MKTKVLLLSAARRLKASPVWLGTLVFSGALIFKIWVATLGGSDLTIHGLTPALIEISKVIKSESFLLSLILIQALLWATVIVAATNYFVQQGSYLTLLLFFTAWAAWPLSVATNSRAALLGSAGMVVPLVALLVIILIRSDQPTLGSPPRFRRYIFSGLILTALMYLEPMWIYSIPAALISLAVMALIREGIIQLGLQKQKSDKNRLFEWGALALTVVALCCPLSPLIVDGYSQLLDQQIHQFTVILKSAGQSINSESSYAAPPTLTLIRGTTVGALILISLTLLVTQVLRRKPEQMFILLLMASSSLILWLAGARPQFALPLMAMCVIVIAFSASRAEMALRVRIRPATNSS
jgi:hypothetical protein